jgi:hypothetical protein
MATGKLTIQPVLGPQERLAFIHFQWDVYQDDPYWVPPLISERVAFLDTERHPFYQHSPGRQARGHYRRYPEQSTQRVPR